MTEIGTSTGEARGRCHCGRVRFVARFPSRFVAHCHCESCRRAHGAAFVTWAGFRSEQVDVIEGDALLGAHESSPHTFRRFCSACGTKLFFESSRWAGETHVTLAAFDDPLDCSPSGHAFVEEHVSWLPFTVAKS
ncbi:MAG TPA: GFA family protein [Casimicrobiaceae bacterium]|nr:GFA family protein [Casimicrobiaceae bacterium]